MVDGNGPDADALRRARLRLGSRIARLRTNAGLSKRQAAASAGLDCRNWGRIEAGELFPRLDSLLRIQHALDIASIEQLLGPMPSRVLLADPDSPANEG